MSPSPAPFEFKPSGSWKGDDGSWSTFQIGVGTPPQKFEVLPSTTGEEVWIPSVEGCDSGFLSKSKDCGELRGANDLHGKPSRGFETNESSTWETIGIYELATEQNLWGTGTDGLYGQDTITLWEEFSNNNWKVESQTVAAVTLQDVWIGNLGLGTALANYTIETEQTPSLLDSMQTQGIIPSRSFGYTAGASYSNISGSLIFGGYDQSRLDANSLILPVHSDTTRQKLQVAVKSIIVQNLAEGTKALLPRGRAVNTIIDSTVSQLWLPQSVCDVFEETFGLLYNSATGLYLVNSTIHQALKAVNPSITFTLGGVDSPTETTDIVLPYAAFDLQVGYPIFSTDQYYFPIRVAANESQQVLGRAFLQEAYVAADWERGNFTIGQAIHQEGNSNIVTIFSPSKNSNSTPVGVIAGGVIGSIAALALIIGLGILFFMRARRRKRIPQSALAKSVELHSSSSEVSEMRKSRTEVFEMSQEAEKKHELVCTQITEMDAGVAADELQAYHVEAKGDIHELP